MNESFEADAPEPKKVGVWTEGARIEPREFIIPKNSPASSDDIPTIPDLDDLQDILEKEISKPPPPSRQATETASTLAEVGSWGAAAGLEAAAAALRARLAPAAREPDAVWTVDSLLAQLLEESGEYTTTE